MTLAAEARTDGHQSPDNLLATPDANTVTTGRIICVSGFADSSRDMANHEPADVEIWGLNRCYTYLKRWDRWFEVHETELYSGKTGLRETDYLDMLRNSGKPIYMQHPDPTVPNALQIPVKEMTTTGGLRDYFTTSIAYMLAMIVYEHDLGQTVSEVRMYGVDMSAYSEYSYQRPCVEYWLGVLDGRGIKVTVPMVSPVLKAIVSYGRHSERLLWSQASARISMLKDNIAKQSANLQAAIGAQSEYQRITDPVKALQAELSGFDIDVDLGDYKKPDLLALAQAMQKVIKEASTTSQKRFKEIQTAIHQMQADLNASMGAQRECQHWLTAFSAPQSVTDELGPVKLPG